MCGIYCSIVLHPLENKRFVNEIDYDKQKILLNRGPDKKHIICIDSIVLAGFVLWQQGNELCVQPAVNEKLILLFNGDAFNIDVGKPTRMSDTEWLLGELSKCKSDTELCDFFKTFEGPFSIIFYNKETQHLYFARDCLGRTSLLIEKDDIQLKIFSATYATENCTGRNCIELPPLGLYKLNISNHQSITVFPWVNPSRQWQDLANIVTSTLQIRLCIAELINPKWLCLKKTRNVPTYDFYKMVKMSYCSINELFLNMLKDPWLSKDLESFSKLIENSVRDRVTKTPKYCANCVKELVNKCHHSKVGILFSGGIDCTILAVLADKYVDNNDSIDLINVAFESLKPSSSNWDVPDRCSAKKSLLDLQSCCPSRKWNFIEVNVLRNDMNFNMHHHIKHLIYPLNTVLDESIGCAFWFASRGIGTSNDILHISSTRVLIVGSGADELFGGYTRHRNAYRHHCGTHEDKLIHVLSELEKDWERIPSRNLGRDDRVIADNGKTSRAPFIEEHVVQFVREKKPCQRCCFFLQEGLGDKLFLRLYGFTLGLTFSVVLKKRAIQFGSRIANKKQNANDLSQFFQPTL